ncbi:sugar ABC transporter permease [Georgenia sp. TF02-10]|uniref:carbohydrate ABC transporter permease n=1 Tax=Georgenia sp. TF02-10 TaxID=2917725 RepID=UPI001FA7016E|nr:sugar ABC transporter permease [Georgenia sp. TF02-10]UNX55148.1 sugar ABC transporter permease [Georgenia sp. TF02-10]
MDFFLYSKIGQMVLALLAFAAVVAVLMLGARVADRVAGRTRNLWALLVFAGPALLLLGVGLIYPAGRTIVMSFMDRRSEEWVALDNYAWVLNNPESLRAFINTFWWVILTPLVATVVGLLYAILIDGKRFEKVAKSLLFMPMAISFVGAGIIWKFVYEYRGAAQDQIGLLNAVLVAVGLEPVRFLQDGPWNTFFLIFVMIWVQAGFAMVLLSAAIKAIPTDIVEAARLDGVSPWQMFRSITVPSIRPTLVVVVTTISIATLKIFDITRTMTGARFGTQVLANQMYDQSFTFGNNGIGSATAVVIFVLVIPIIVYNVRQMLRNREVRGA